MLAINHFTCWILSLYFGIYFYNLNHDIVDLLSVVKSMAEETHTTIASLLSSQSQDVGGRDKWCFCGRVVPRSEIVFLSQTITILIVVLASVINLSLGHNSDVWLILLSTSLGKKVFLFCSYYILINFLFTLYWLLFISSRVYVT